MKVTHAGCLVNVEVTADGEGLVSRVGSALVARVSDKVGLTGGLSRRLGDLNARRSRHDLGCVVRDLAVMLADGGDCLADLGVLGDQEALFGPVASTSTAFRAIDRIARDAQGLKRLRAAHAQARARAWQLLGAPRRLDIDVDATLLTAHSEKAGAAGNFKHGFGFRPLVAYGDQTGEAMGGVLRPGNAGANTAVDQIAVAALALEQIPSEHIETLELLLRADSAGASHELIEWCRQAEIRFSVGYDLSETVRTAILQTPEECWVSSIDQDQAERPNGQVSEITEYLDLRSWPTGTRVIVRRERPHPGAQLTFTDHDGHSFQAILTDQPSPDLADLERHHRARARAEDDIRNDKDTGLRNLPFRDFNHNEVWLQIVLLAHDLITWTQPAASRSTPAAPGYASKQAGPGPLSSPPRSSDSTRSPNHPADPDPSPATNSTALRRPQRPNRLPDSRPRASRSPPPPLTRPR